MRKLLGFEYHDEEMCERSRASVMSKPNHRAIKTNLKPLVIRLETMPRTLASAIVGPTPSPISIGSAPSRGLTHRRTRRVSPVQVSVLPRFVPPAHLQRGDHKIDVILVTNFRVDSYRSFAQRKATV